MAKTKRQQVCQTHPPSEGVGARLIKRIAGSKGGRYRHLWYCVDPSFSSANFSKPENTCLSEIIKAKTEISTISIGLAGIKEFNLLCGLRCLPCI